MTTSNQMRNVFISYATQDRKRAFEICGYLEALGHPCWIAPRDIRVGEDYAEEIIRGIEGARCLVLILSAAANGSKFVKREVERAVSKGKPVFPVRVEDVLPSPALEFHLASVQFLDAWSGMLKAHIEQLAREIEKRADEPVQPVVPQPEGPVWKQPAVVAGSIAALAAVVAVLSIVSRRPPPVVPPSVKAPGRTELASRAEDPGEKRRVGAPRMSCRLAVGPTLRCDVGDTGRIKVRSRSGEALVIEGGSGTTQKQRDDYSSRLTFLPWPGVGATAQLSLPDGSWTPAQPLPDLAAPAAAFIGQNGGDKPALAYTIERRADWMFLFFAPPNVQDVEWTADAKGYIRAELRPWQAQSGGPYWIAAADPAGTHLSVRWRRAGEEWSAPADYSFDTAALRKAVAASLADPARQIACYRAPGTPLLTICQAAQAYALGEVFSELYWGASADGLADVSAYDFGSLSRKLLAGLPPAPDCNLREAECVHSRNTAIGAQRALEFQLNSLRSRLAPWPQVPTDGRRDFLATDASTNEIFFKAVPRGGGAAIVVRIPVKPN